MVKTLEHKNITAGTKTKSIQRPEYKVKHQEHRKKDKKMKNKQYKGEKIVLSQQGQHSLTEIPGRKKKKKWRKKSQRTIT